jgi:hypothetical protein
MIGQGGGFRGIAVIAVIGKSKTKFTVKDAEDAEEAEKGSTADKRRMHADWENRRNRTKSP